MSFLEHCAKFDSFIVAYDSLQHSVNDGVNKPFLFFSHKIVSKYF